MSSVPAPRTDRMAESDLVTELRCGEPALDDFFRKHALARTQSLVRTGRSIKTERLAIWGFRA